MNSYKVFLQKPSFTYHTGYLHRAPGGGPFFYNRFYRSVFHLLCETLKEALNRRSTGSYKTVSITYPGPSITYPIPSITYATPSITYRAAVFHLSAFRPSA
ncbi:hypothetical protein ACVWZM_005222 [Bradyrhizobium sp. USDA 4501]